MPIADPEVLADAAAVAEAVAARLLQARQDHSDLPLGLATGRTMEPVYGALVRRIKALPQPQQQTLRDGWCSFNLDEYVGLGPEDSGSFAAAMERQLAAPLGLERGRLQLPDGLASDPAQEANRYGTALAAVGGLSLQLLGLGLNGHIGFNEPPCGAQSRSRCVTLSASTRAQNAGAFGGSPEAVPGQAITVGLAEILAARQILLVVTGAAKSAVLQRLLQDPPGPQLPASWLQLHPAVTLIVDRAACGED
jgi:glucosamine-6-phosphate deaminase